MKDANEQEIKNLQHCLSKFLRQVAAQEPSALQQVRHNQEQMAIQDNAFIFTLLGLHHVAQTQFELSFQHFKRLLYASNLNAELQSQGLIVEVHQAKRPVDQSWYRLVSILPKPRAG